MLRSTLGERFPVLNASYAPIFNSPQISQVLGNQSYVPPFPSVSYEDLGTECEGQARRFMAMAPSICNWNCKCAR